MDQAQSSTQTKTNVFEVGNKVIKLTRKKARHHFLCHPLPSFFQFKINLCARVVMAVLGPAFLARVRDSRNAMESEKLK